MLIAATLVTLWLALAIWAVLKFRKWSGPSAAEVDSDLIVAAVERVHVRAAGDVQ